MAEFHTPNRLAFGNAYGPPDYGIFGPIPTQPNDDRDMWAPICRALALIQEHTTFQIRMPAEMERDEALGILDAAKLLSGEPTTGTASGQSTITHTAATRITPQLERISDFLVIRDLGISLGGEEITIGKKLSIYRGQYVEIGEQQSKIEVSGNAITLRYTGDLEVGRTFARYVDAEGASSEVQ